MQTHFLHEAVCSSKITISFQAVLAKERLQREVEREGKEKDEKQQALQESLRSIAEVGK